MCQKDGLSQEADKMCFVFNKPYLCKFDLILVWKITSSKKNLKSRLITSVITWNMYSQGFIWIHIFLDYSVSFFIISLIDGSVAKVILKTMQCSKRK